MKDFRKGDRVVVSPLGFSRWAFDPKRYREMVGTIQASPHPARGRPLERAREENGALLVTVKWDALKTPQTVNVAFLEREAT